jgi:hypothetical protein
MAAEDVGGLRRRDCGGRECFRWHDGVVGTRGRYRAHAL